MITPSREKSNGINVNPEGRLVRPSPPDAYGPVGSIRFSGEDPADISARVDRAHDMIGDIVKRLGAIEERLESMAAPVPSPTKGKPDGREDRKDHEFRTVGLDIHGYVHVNFIHDLTDRIRKIIKSHLSDDTTVDVRIVLRAVDAADFRYVRVNAYADVIVTHRFSGAFSTVFLKGLADGVVASMEYGRPEEN